ncbi:MAG TPA: hypothetical protein VFS63_15315 [Pseudolabrys sp.]|jgi:hypothetical protein|nr:hypothetical protein [Pseudolabrys sp.]
MSTSLRKLLVAAGAIAAITMASTAPASARWHGWHHHGWHRGGWGLGFAPGFIGGLALGAAVASPYYYGGPYAYYGPRCYLSRRLVVDPWGYRHWRRVRVCY